MEALQDPSIILYYKFLCFVLRMINKTNIHFQKEGSTIHLYHELIRDLYQNLLGLYYNRDKIKRTSLFEDIDPSDKSNFLPINQIYLGATVHEISNTPKYITNQEILMGVKVICRGFLITICSEIKYRFSGTEQLMKLCFVFSFFFFFF